MIQRIQSVYLLLATLFSTAMLFTNQVVFKAVNTLYGLNFLGFTDLATGTNVGSNSTIALTILLILCPVLSLFTIFLYKNRGLQMRLCGAGIGLSLGSLALFYYFISVGVDAFGTDNYNLQFSMAFPIVAAILNYLAIRGILKDMALLRSMDRIR